MAASPEFLPSEKEDNTVELEACTTSLEEMDLIPASSKCIACNDTYKGQHIFDGKVCHPKLRWRYWRYHDLSCVFEWTPTLSDEKHVESRRFHGDDPQRLNLSLKAKIIKACDSKRYVNLIVSSKNTHVFDKGWLRSVDYCVKAKNFITGNHHTLFEHPRDKMDTFSAGHLSTSLKNICSAEPEDGFVTSEGIMEIKFQFSAIDYQYYNYH